jgi:hypothetical protein
MAFNSSGERFTVSDRVAVFCFDSVPVLGFLG